MAIHLRIGSRRSRLAQRQAQLCAEAIAPYLPEGSTTQIKIFQTTGDAYLSGAISDIGNKGLFTKEIEQALIDGEVDIAVHSMKDVATVLPSRLIIPAMLARDDPRDVLLCAHAASIEAIPYGATVGTSSLRRKIQVKHLRPDLQVVGYRGNLDRRIVRLESGIVDATLLAAAGLDRLNMALDYAHIIPLSVMLPAVAQGAIGLQCRTNDTAMQELLLQANDAETFLCVNAERSMLRALDGSCRTPIAGYAVVNDGVMTLEGMLADEEGTLLIQDKLQAPLEDALALGKELAEHLQRQFATSHVPLLSERGLI